MHEDVWLHLLEEVRQVVRRLWEHEPDDQAGAVVDAMRTLAPAFEDESDA